MLKSLMIKKIVLNDAMLFVMLLFLVSLITVVTLLSSTSHVTKGYVLTELDEEYNLLVQESEHREMQISEVRSLDYIRNSAHLNYMISNTEITYIGVGDSVIASR